MNTIYFFIVETANIAKYFYMLDCINFMPVYSGIKVFWVKSYRLIINLCFNLNNLQFYLLYTLFNSGGGNIVH